MTAQSEKFSPLGGFPHTSVVAIYIATKYMYIELKEAMVAKARRILH